MPSVKLFDGSMYYGEKKAITTTSPPLVLIHGAGGTHLDWPPELRRLPDTRVIGLDLPGHGRSTGPGRSDTLIYAQDVCAFLDKLEIERAIFAGHSMGGAIVLQIGLNMPQRAAGLILMGTGSKLPVEPTLPQRIIDEPETTVDWIINTSWSAHVPESFKQLGRQRLLDTNPEVLRDDYLACQSFDVRDRIEQITAPSLVLGAADDQMVKLKFSATLAERIPHSRLVTIEGAGHMFPLEQGQAVSQAVSEWLAEELCKKEK
jgi:pimeloyl-ACP methyl ester carboxylesterase